MPNRILPRALTKWLSTSLRIAGMFAALLCPALSSAQDQATPPTTGNQIMGQVDFHGKTGLTANMLGM
jgi:hypothetical protein